MSDDNIIHAFPASELPENLVQIGPRPPGVPYHCDHGSIRLDEHERLVQCAKCNATLDPFQFLMNQAIVLRSAWQNYQATRHQLNDLTERVNNLKKEEQRIKARIKRTQDKLTVIEIKPTN